MTSNGQWEFLDYIALMGFCIGFANYNENVGQSQMQDAIQGAVDEINQHLQDQDEKLNKIIGGIEH